MKLVLILGSLLLLMSMGAKPVTKPIEVTVAQPHTAIEQASKFLMVSKCDNCTVAEFDRIKAAESKVNDVIIGSCFREKLTAMPLIQTEGRSPHQVVDHLAASRVKVDTEMYRTVKRVLGYTIPGIDKIWLNRNKMMKWGVCDTASLLAHEASHKAGYHHDYKATSRRPNSVPYSINRAFEACCTK